MATTEEVRSHALDALASLCRPDDATKLRALGSGSEHVDFQIIESVVRGATAAWRVRGTYRLRAVVKALETTGA